MDAKLPTHQVLVRATINAGVEIFFRGARILCDALHKEPIFQFSSLNEEMIQRIWAEHQGQEPDVVFFSHGHPDHCSPELAQEAAQHWPNATFVAPLPVCDRQITLHLSQETHTVSGIRMTFLKTSHMPLAVPEGPHYACFISINGFTVLFSGDTDVSDPALAAFLKDKRTDLAIMDFPWWMFPRGRRVIESVIRPAHLFLHHFPSPENDRDHLLDNTLARVREYQGPMDIKILNRPFQEEVLTIPEKDSSEPDRPIFNNRKDY